jgi:hypothetical protein
MSLFFVIQSFAPYQIKLIKIILSKKYTIGCIIQKCSYISLEIASRHLLNEIKTNDYAAHAYPGLSDHDPTQDVCGRHLAPKQRAFSMYKPPSLFTTKTPGLAACAPCPRTSPRAVPTCVERLPVRTKKISYENFG